MSTDQHDFTKVTKTKNFHQAFEKAISDKRPFMVFRIPGRNIEEAVPDSKTEFLVKPWSKEAFSLYEVGTQESHSLPEQTSKIDYEEAFKKYRKAFQTGSLKKAILSTVIRKKKALDFDPIGFFIRLCESYPTAFTYLLYHPETGTWSGASPEVLLEGSGDQFQTVALAGTQSINASNEYRWGKKEVEEQELVSEHIRGILKKLEATEIKESMPATVQAGSVAHLKTNFRFTYNRGVQSLLDELHPTPAVAGLPVKKSLDLIKEAEKHPRGLYTGYLGLLSNEETRVFVNLRCMQIGSKELALYVGGGITAKSDMDAEWEETRLKAETLLNLLKSTA